LKSRILTNVLQPRDAAASPSGRCGSPTSVESCRKVAAVMFRAITPVTFQRPAYTRIFYCMRQSAAVWCRDNSSLAILRACLEEQEIELLACKNGQKALEQILAGRCSTLIVDFDLDGAEEVMRMAALLPPPQKPELLAIARRAWPGTGEAFHSGANRILYRPLNPEEVRDAFRPERQPAKKAQRKAARHELKTLVYLDFGNATHPAITIDISEHGLALQAPEPVPMSSNLHFRCALPGTDFTLDGHADVIWASEKGRAGLFFSKLSASSRKHLKKWLQKRSHAGRHGKDDGSVRDLLPPKDAHVEFSLPE
jgi:CheY-like chemotaxis protein